MQNLRRRRRSQDLTTLAGLERAGLMRSFQPANNSGCIWDDSGTTFNPATPSVLNYASADLIGTTLPAAGFTIARVYPSWASNVGAISNFPRIIEIGDGSTGTKMSSLVYAVNSFGTYVPAALHYTAALTFAAGSANALISRWSPSSTTVLWNSTAAAGAAGTTGEAISVVDIGRRADATPRAFTGKLGPIVFGLGVLSDAHAATVSTLVQSGASGEAIVMLLRSLGYTSLSVLPMNGSPGGYTSVPFDVPTAGSLDGLTATGAISQTLAGSDVCEKNADTQAQCFSLAKLVTAYVARQYVTDEMLDDPVTTLLFDVAGGTAVGFADGDVTTWRDLFYGMLVPSGNDAARAIARLAGAIIDDQESSPGNMARFVTEMNAVATSLGWTGLVLASPNGNEQDSTLSPRQTAHIMRLASDDDFLLTVMGTMAHDITVSAGPDPRTIPVAHTVAAVVDQFPEFVAAKTGSSGTYNVTLLWDSTKGGQRVSVIMDDTSSDRYVDLRSLMDLDTSLS